ncbi:uncharacterized protein LOC113757260 [Coffea eugenioides]|uniref:uncharacterized protein LOC113757005 n=1 Tax=Coffea eugenioides TaxID=49369 RepID=UPI000F60E92D|nr:uncharacterized protein LOC113757005 [Coffea eugenioides]XP_027156430.1 uncharacterized protein LOC113757260 [Coffea eugenioides]
MVDIAAGRYIGDKTLEEFEKKSNLEEMMLQYMQKVDQKMDQFDKLAQSQQASIQNLKRQVGQLVKVVTKRAPGKLPSSTEVNPKETTMAVTLRSGKVLDDLVIKSKTKPSAKHRRSGIAIKSEETGDSGNGSCEKIKGKIINFLKEIVSNKKKLEDFVEVSLTEECSAMLQNGFPIKMKDPESFNVPCQFEHIIVDKCLCDHGYSVNLISLSFFRKLKFANLGPIQVILQLADRSVCYPIGIVDDLLVKVGKFYFPTDLLVLDMEEDICMPIILGREVLAMEEANIDLLEGKLILSIGKEKEKFNVFELLK